MTKRLGPKTILTDELISDLCTVVRNGNYYLTACRRVGVPYDAFRKWMTRGRAEIVEFGDDPTHEPTIYAHFVIALEHCADEVQECLVQDVIHGDLKSKMWFLERRWGKLFTRNQNSFIDDDVQEEIKVDAVAVLLSRLEDLKRGS